MAKPKKKTTTTTKTSRRGGARPNSGPARDQFPQAVLEKLGPPPATAEALDLWTRRVLAEVSWCVAKGEIGATLAATLRATCGELRRNLATVPDEDDEDQDDEDGGPKLELSDSGDEGSELRVDR
ncbi:MAG: hypothetical protein ACKV2T_17175 [Kofleriaceae bacterium]